MKSGRNIKPKHRWLSGMAGAIAAMAGIGAAVIPMTGVATSARAFSFLMADEDSIILKSGNIEIKGEIIAETETTITFKGRMSGILIEKEYKKDDLLSIKRGKKPDAKPETTKPDGSKPAPGPATAKPDTGKTDAPKADDAAGKTKIYVIDMGGEFGVDVSQTPLRNAMKDALKNEAEVIICTLDSKPPRSEFDEGPPPAVEQLFDQIFRAEAMTPIFVEEMVRDWKVKPRLVFWIKDAIGGSAMLPFVCPEVYMAKEAHWGGIGYLTNQFDGVGDAVVREKQYSLRIGHAQGWANTGGYDIRLINAMAVAPYVMSYKIVGDKVELYERMPDPLKGEILLTDDAEGPNRDSIKDILNNKSNDCLTFNAPLAEALKVSKGTVDTLDDLIYKLGYSRTGKIIEGRSKTITDGWKREITEAKKAARKYWEEFLEARVEAPGDYPARTKFRGLRRNRLERILGVCEKYEESITPQWRAQNRIPPYNATLRQLIDNIKAEQLADGPGR